jgi:protein-tyrosine kinase
MDQIRKALDKARVERTQVRAAVLERREEPSPGAYSRTPGDRVATGDRSGVSAMAPSEGAGVAEHRRSTPFAVDAAVLDRNRLVLPTSHGAAAGAFRLLRTQVLKRMRERDWRTVGIVSARSGDGKTTVAGNLAIAIAADPRHTSLLVDLDLRRPGVGALFGVSPAVGVDDVLAGRAGVDQAFMQPENVDRLRLMAVRAPVADSSSVVAGAACHGLVRELRERYLNRVVLFDAPPVLEADDAVTLAAQFDCLLFVVAEGRTAREDVVRALALLKDTPVVGTVLNRSVEAVHSEAYG